MCDKKTKCVECGRTPITNKKNQLCRFCMFFKTNGITYQEHVIKKNKERLEEKKSKGIYSGIKRDSIVKNPLSLGSSKKCPELNCHLPVFKGNLCWNHYRIKTGITKKTYRIKTNNKEIKIKNELSKIKKEAKTKHVEDNGGVCEGCNKHYSVLDYSHILSVGQRKDLELNIDNKNMLCRTCHEKWESYNAEKLLSLNCLMSNMKFIRQHDTKIFWKIYFIFNDELMFDICKKIEEIDNNFK